MEARPLRCCDVSVGVGSLFTDEDDMTIDPRVEN